MIIAVLQCLCQDYSHDTTRANVRKRLLKNLDFYRPACY